MMESLLTYYSFWYVWVGGREGFGSGRVWGEGAIELDPGLGHAPPRGRVRGVDGLDPKRMGGLIKIWLMVVILYVYSILYSTVYVWLEKSY
jgi:hypothetical protein